MLHTMVYRIKNENSSIDIACQQTSAEYWCVGVYATKHQIPLFQSFQDCHMLHIRRARLVFTSLTGMQSFIMPNQIHMTVSKE